MIVYVPVGSGPLREKIIAMGHGMIATRREKGYIEIPRYGRWIMDNGAFGDWKHGRKFNGAAYMKSLNKVLTLQPCRRPEWAICPDRVAHPESLKFSLNFRLELPDDLQWFLAVQDGMKPPDVDCTLERAKFHGIFIGGSTDWKNQHACQWVEFARNRKLPVHIGRINGWKRLQWAVDLGADSVDGTGWTRAGARWLGHLANLPKPTPMLFT